eukprot:m.55710 g.55710  ORF g.55710 m.55710 type:complete len:978 (+) comp11511_c0_seq1:321-3254(+)
MLPSARHFLACAFRSSRQVRFVHYTGVMSASDEWTGQRVRDTFISFFQDKKEHTFWPSSSTIPHDDPTLLFANAGMNQFKPIFQGTVDPQTDLGKLTRAVNSQKCIRAGGKHNDLDDVGKDVYHHTFFEMLGNWSFGNFFKKEAIEWAWELLTEVYKLDKDRLYVTYFQGSEEDGVPCDDEARDLWLQFLPADRVLPFDKKDNFWEMGDVGPCGPCSEIHYDHIGGRDAAALVNMDDPDVVEIWNLVFMQFNRENDGSLKRLPACHVDTGMGLERLLTTLQKKRSNYDTELFTAIFDAIQRGTGVRAYTGKVGKEDVDGIDTAYRVVADHIRTLTVAISDGGEPDKVGRGYTLRLILRRAIRFSEEYLNAPEGFFASLVPVVVDLLGDSFPELKKDPAYVQELLIDEERLFRRTLARGRRLFVKAANEATDKTISGDVAWKLYDTYGFPIDLTKVMAEERDLVIDMAAFEAAREKAVLISKSGERATVDGLVLDVHKLDELKSNGVPATDDSAKYDYTRQDNGKYTFNDATAKVLALVTLEGFQDNVEAGDNGCNVGVILDRTNFYAEQGGQSFDTGYFKDASGDLDFTIIDVQKKGPYCFHIGFLENGALNVGDELTLSFDDDRRRPLMSNHTATHVLNFGLRQVLGAADQKGSLVESDRLRFDFTAKKALTPQQVADVEVNVKDVIAAGLPVYDKLAPLQQARDVNGLRAMFGETYPDPVRVISVGAEIEGVLADPAGDAAINYSLEFCGGTHVKNSADIGAFAILSEEAVAKGIRRIVAVTGQEAKKAFAIADEFEQRVHDDLKVKEVAALEQEVGATSMPAVRKEALRSKLKALSKKHADIAKALRKERAANAKARAQELIESAAGPVVIEVLDVGANPKAIGEALRMLKAELPETAFLFFGVEEGSVCYNAQVPKSMVAAGFKAGDWIKAVNEQTGGRGGGKDLVAQGASQDEGVVDAAMAAAKEYAQQFSS